MVANMTRPTCRRVGDCWAIDVRGLRGVHTQTRRLDQAEAMTREAIALLHDVPPDSLEVNVEAHLDEEADRTLRAVLTALRWARQASEQASRLQWQAVEQLLSRYGLTVRDAGTLLNVSPQRISQLAHHTKAGKPGRAAACRRVSSTGAAK